MGTTSRSPSPLPRLCSSTTARFSYSTRPGVRSTPSTRLRTASATRIRSSTSARLSPTANGPSYCARECCTNGPVTLQPKSHDDDMSLLSGAHHNCDLFKIRRSGLANLLGNHFPHRWLLLPLRIHTVLHRRYEGWSIKIDLKYVNE